MVIFGAAGDLTRRKLIPALYNLAKSELLSREFAVVGVARAPCNRGVPQEGWKDIKAIRHRRDRSRYLGVVSPRACITSRENSATTNMYAQPQRFAEKVDQDHATHGNIFYYLATAADYFGPVVEQLAAVGLIMQEDTGWRRVIIEKPFGHDIDSARALNKQLLKVANEQQIYRIDHYLGKETVQNILALRFANGIFEPVWNRRYIDHIQISVAETVGVEDRGSYYDTRARCAIWFPTTSCSSSA